ncbi:amidohydrolase family protein [Corallococcus macrosporus]|uniref:Amidohydrolase family protein n=1 Tax=Corallococcus macrosporus TaxID=35 RepID=A0ABS3D5T1_9BACT|nr:amidohydrolase family protein [Corallococcus macrosporus]MBN8227019.1 amidohydrolase family protein [Corallococcus macrosporus]
MSTGASIPKPADAVPRYVLEGRVVTVNSRDEVLERGRVLVRGSRIVAVEPSGGALPESFRDAPVIDTRGTLYPGLIDLHNHFVYDVLTLWRVPKRYLNRTQWPRHADYGPLISLPVRVLGGHAPTARAIVRYIEAKALLAGTTTGQGIRTRVSGGEALFRGAMRNVEEPRDDHLPAGSTRVMDLHDDAEDIQSFRDALSSRAAYFYHLGEGVDDYAHRRYLDLAEHDLIQPSLIGIHSLGLHRQDLDTMADKGAKVVWSPFSNLLLYGQTLPISDLLGAGVTFSLGCDWSPTGSKNLLQELKVARHEAQRQGASLSSRALVRSVTADAARVTGWQTQVGTLRANALADLLVIAGTDGDPYDTLISATEKDVRLVTVDGVARFGDRALMDRLAFDPSHPSETWTLDGVEKAFCLWAEDSPLNDLGFEAARALLEEAMADLPDVQRRMEHAEREAVGPPPFELVLDNEPQDVFATGPDASTFLTDLHRVAGRITLDAPTVGGPDYWELLAAQTNLDDSLKQQLRQDYA